MKLNQIRSVMYANGKLEEVTALTMAIEALDLLKNVNWIPVSERLPEESGFYNVSVINMHDRAYTKCAYYDKRSNFWHAKQEIVAWRPPLEPYQEERQDEYSKIRINEDI